MSLNGLKEHDKALQILESIKDCGDNLVKAEYTKTLKILHKEDLNNAEFYKKMFDQHKEKGDPSKCPFASKF